MISRRYANISDSLAHIALLGISLGLIVNQNTFVFGLITTIIAGIGIEYFRQHNILKGESALVLFTVTSLSSLAIIQQKIPLRRSLESILFGSVLNLEPSDIILTGILSIATILFVSINYKQLLNISINEDLAKVLGIPVKAYNYMLMTLAAIIISISLELIGGLLIGGIMIIPVLTARLYKLSFKKTIFMSVFFSVLAVWLGILSGWLLDLPSGAAIVMTSIIFFGISFATNILFKE